MPEGVYTRARARNALIYIETNNNNNVPYIPTPTHYIYWGLRGSFSCARVIHQGHDKTQRIEGAELCVVFAESEVLFTIPSQNLLPLT